MTTQSLWIVIAIIAAIVLIALAVGWVLRSRRRISLREADQLPPSTTDTAPPRRGGTYRTEQAFDFSSGAVTDSPPEPPPPDPPRSPRRRNPPPRHPVCRAGRRRCRPTPP